MCRELLSGSRTARLQRGLVEGGGQEALGVSCSRAWPGEKHGNCLVLQAVPASNVSLEALDGALYRQVSALAEDGPTLQELQRAAKAAKLDVFDAMQSNSSMAAALCSHHVLTRSWRTFLRDIALLEELRPEDVRDVAARLFAPGNCFTGIVNAGRGGNGSLQP